jgi:site-specific recombinase XerD
MPPRSRSSQRDQPTRFDVEHELARVFGDGVRPLRLEEALFEAILAGWVRQQRARLLSEATIRPRAALVRRLHAHAGAWPWEWRAEDLEEWIEDLAVGPPGLHVSTLRSYQIAIRLFCEYLIDRRYPWVAICRERLGAEPEQIVDERNLIVHVAEFEADPRRRPLSRGELQAFFDHCDAQVAGRHALKRKGSLAALRDAAMFKTIYAWGLRRREAAKLDVVDFSRNPHKPAFGAFGALSVRYGKAMASGPPRRRSVLTVFDWAVEVIEQYLREIRPLYGRDEHPALWLTERGGRVKSTYISERFAAYRRELGLAPELTPHGLRHSYVTHLIEDGFDPLFVQMQVGHRHASTTAIYTAVNGDYKQRALADALAQQLAPTGGS